MLQYNTTNESKTSSHFFIKTEHESLFGLLFDEVDIEVLDFNNDFLQENVVEMKIVRFTEQRENFSKSLAKTIKGIFDKQLYKHDNHILYISVEENKWKKKLIDSYISDDNNDEFHYLNYSINGYSFYFFFNERKTSSIKTLLSIMQFFKDEFGVEFKM